MTVRLGVILLCHDVLDRAAQMARLWAGGGAAVAVHIDARTPRGAAAAMRARLADLPQVSFTPRHKCEWGMFSLVVATQEAARQLLNRYPDVTHFYLASGTCLPLRPPAELEAYLEAHPNTDFIESVAARDVGWTMGGLNEERFSLFFPFSWRKQRALFDASVAIQRWLGVKRKMPTGVAPYLGSQWWCLTRATLAAILNDPRRDEFERYFRHTWVPDESYFQSLARRHSARIESRSLTLSKFDAQGKPYTFYDDHQPMLEQSHCFVARKIWPRAAGLYRSFPKPSRPEPQTGALPEPASLRIDRLITNAVARRKLGRPGLYMQSRYPLRDRENGKTAAPYLVFQGFSDLFPDFERWVAPLLDADMHGHLFAPDGVEFGGRVAVGPGGLPASTEVRDYDQKGFLTNLIRVTAPRRQAMLFSPRDSGGLDWFVATDPNLNLAIISGAWAVPLLRSEMPFDDIRRIAAKLQRREIEQINIMRSVWTKARVQIWDLADFLARPAAITQEVLHEFGYRGTVPPLPVMRRVGGMGAFLQRLRNAGLQPQSMGEFSSHVAPPVSRVPMRPLPPDSPGQAATPEPSEHPPESRPSP